jgi:hypothetical protein
MRLRRISWALAFVLVAVVGAIGLYLLMNQVASLPERAASAFIRQSTTGAQQVRDAFVDLFRLQPKIVVHEQVIFEEAKPALELAVISRETQVSHETDQTWLGSTKHLRLSGTYLVKAGYDLNDKLEVEVRGQTIVIHAPPPKILSVEQEKVSVEELQDGLWNKILPHDVETEIMQLPRLAETKEKTLPTEAAEQFRKLLQQRLPDFDVQVESPTNSRPQSK